MTPVRPGTTRRDRAERAKQRSVRFQTKARKGNTRRPQKPGHQRPGGLSIGNHRGAAGTVPLAAQGDRPARQG
jgi:hypothetical protein